MSDAATAPIPAARFGRHLSERVTRTLLIAPAVLLMAVFVLFPVVLNIFSSIWIDGGPSLENYQVFFGRGQYLAALQGTLSLSFIVACLSLVLAYPLSAFFAAGGKAASAIFLAVLGLSFAISGLIRIFSWQLLLSRFGALNGFLGFLGVPITVDVLYTQTAVIISMVQIMLPYAAAILFAGMRRVDKEIIFAARTLGATPMQVLLRAYWPQMRVSTVNAFLIVFVLSTGFFVAPVLLGGPNGAVMGTVMFNDLTYNFERGVGLAATSGVALTCTLIVATGIALVLAGKPYHHRGRRR
jgi:ABC-type spermidine/putrescine transport system permease subunit I